MCTDSPHDKPSTANLVDKYIRLRIFRMSCRHRPDEMCTMCPDLRPIMCGSTARLHRKQPVTLTPLISCQASSLRSANGAASPAIPALLTSTSTWPNRSKTLATILSTCDASLTSVSRAIAERPPDTMPSATRSPRPRSRSAITVFAPSSATARAMCSPKPLPPPVTITVCPSRRRAKVSSLRRSELTPMESTLWRTYVQEIRAGA